MIRHSDGEYAGSAWRELNLRTRVTKWQCSFLHPLLAPVRRTPLSSPSSTSRFSAARSFPLSPGPGALKSPSVPPASRSHPPSQLLPFPTGTDFRPGPVSAERFRHSLRLPSSLRMYLLPIVKYIHSLLSFSRLRLSNVQRPPQTSNWILTSALPPINVDCHSGIELCHTRGECGVECSAGPVRLNGRMR